MQILVVVASIQMIALKTEEEKGSVTTAIDYGLDGPKSLGNSSLGAVLGLLRCSRCSKGKQVNIPVLKPEWAATQLISATAEKHLGRVLSSP